ncbi:MAG: hypothetical protein VB064_10200 [Oscillospiraceae bacterium]|nr:hypothetical protein [Oscillospiraceae bacterium]
MRNEYSIKLLHTVDTLKTLYSDAQSLMTTARKNLCQLTPATYKQTDGLNTVLPISRNYLRSRRTLTTGVSL